MKMSQLKMVIREVVREEIRLGLKDIVSEIKKPIQSEQIVKKPKLPKKQNYSKNPVLNEMLNETAKEEWETLGGTTFTSEKMNDVMGGAYSDLMNKNPETPVTVDGQQPDFLKKDYRALMKAVDEKKQQKMGR
jgi:hypothetical protein